MGFTTKITFTGGAMLYPPEPKCLSHSERKLSRFYTTNRQYFLKFYQATLLKTAVSDSSFFVASFEKVNLFVYKILQHN